VFLDIERMEKMPQAMRDYYGAWTKRLREHGQYRPGVYVHAHNAQAVYDDVKAAFFAAGVDEEPRIWVASGRGWEEGKAPQDVGFDLLSVRPEKRSDGTWAVRVTTLLAPLARPLDVLSLGDGRVLILEYTRPTDFKSKIGWLPGRILELAPQ
jgi:hypothetical protein